MSRTLVEAMEGMSPEARGRFNEALTAQIFTAAATASPQVALAVARRYTLERYTGRVAIDVASLKRVPPQRSSGFGGDPWSVSRSAAWAAQDAATVALLGPELERQRRSFQAEVGAKLKGKHRADVARQDAWLLAQSRTAAEACAERPFAWQAVVSPVRATPLYDYDTRLGADLSERREYELVAYGCAFVLPEDVPVVESLAASRHQNVQAMQLPLTITPKLLLDDPLLAARRLSYEEYVAFVDRLTGGAAAAAEKMIV